MNDPRFKTVRLNRVKPNKYTEVKRTQSECRNDSTESPEEIDHQQTIPVVPNESRQEGQKNRKSDNRVRTNVSTLSLVSVPRLHILQRALTPNLNCVTVRTVKK